MSVFPFLSAASNTAFLFPGQGSQHIGMVAELVATYSVARAALEEADDTLGFALSRLMLDGPEDDLTDTINAQPALLAASVAVMAALSAEIGERMPAHGTGNFVAGHSMGEYSALVAAGSLTYGDGLRLVRARGRLMKEAGMQAPGMMAAVLGLNEARVAELCAEISATAGIVQIANDNCPGQLVISGDRTGMEAAMQALAAAGARKVVPLAVSIAAHSQLMQPAADALRSAIDATPLVDPAVPVVGNTTAQPLSSADSIRAELAAQLTGNVRWTDSIQAMVKAGVTTFVELGAGDVLTSLVKRIDRSVLRIAVNEPAGVRAYSAMLS